MERKRIDLIDEADLKGWLEEQEAMFAHATRERKRLLCSLKGVMRITVGSRTVWTGTDPKEAVDTYNGITERYTEPKSDFTL